MNEPKTEDVMRALDILDKMDFFQGQRAGRELWFEKPFDVQEQDVADFSQGIAFVKNIIADADAFALIREMKKQIRELEDDVENFKSIAEYQQNCNVNRYHIIKEKDAEIERLTKERDDARRDCAVAEQLHYECKMELEEMMSDDILDSVRAERDRYKAESDQYQSAMLKAQAVCVEMGKLNQAEIAKARADAINEFAEKLKTFYNRLPGKTVGGSVEYHIDQIAKEMKGGEQQ